MLVMINKVKNVALMSCFLNSAALQSQPILEVVNLEKDYIESCLVNSFKSENVFSLPVSNVASAVKTEPGLFS